jgi:enoyl-CoA hydratase
MDHAGHERLRIERRGAVLNVTLDAPDKLNAIDYAMECELLRLFQDLRDDRETAVVVLGGAGRAFSAGGDLQHNLKLLTDAPSVRQEFDLARRFVNTLLDVEQPIIARIHGDAVGLGATLALLCDLTVMAEGARIGDPHVRVGLVAGDGGAVAWPLLVGYARAKRYLLGGELLDAAEAGRIGLVSEVVPAAELDAAVQRWAERFARGPLLAQRWTKATLNIGLKAQAAMVLDAGLGYEMASLHTADHREAIEAFLARRKPEFSGR